MNRFLKLLVLLSQVSQAPAVETKDLSILDGAWTVTRVEFDGKVVRKREDESIFRFKDGKFYIVKGKSTEWVGTFSVDPTTEPKRLDIFVKEDGPNKDKVCHGIFLVRGQDLTLCQARPGCERPLDFQSSDECSVIYLRRVGETTK